MRRPIQKLFACVVAIATCASASTASAAPTVTASFVNDARFTIDIAHLQARDGLDVTVRNESSRKQQLTLRVIGLEPLAGADDAALRKMLRAVKVSKRLAPRQIAVLRLPLGVDLTPARSGDFAATLVLYGAQGPIARRRFTVHVPVAVPPGTRGTQLAAADLSDLTIQATNYVPSPSSPSGPTLVALGLILALGSAALLLAWAITSVLSGVQLGLTLAGVAIGITLVAAGVTHGAFHDGGQAQRARSDIRVASWPSVFQAPADGVYGAVTDEGGAVGRLAISDGLLKIQDLSHAGSYSGTLDLTPGEEKGSATVKVNVRDWWPYAFLVIAAGVGLGLIVRHAFTKEIPRDELTADAERLLDRVRRDDSAWLQEHGATPIAGYRILERMTFSINDVGEKAIDDLAGARTGLDKLKGYPTAFAELRSALETLMRRTAKLRDSIVSAPVPSAVVTATELMGKPFDAPNLDPEAKKLAERLAAVVAATDRVDEVSRLHETAVLHGKLAETAAAGARGTRKTELDKLVTDIGAADAMLLAATGDLAPVKQTMNELMAQLATALDAVKDVNEVQAADLRDVVQESPAAPDQLLVEVFEEIDIPPLALSATLTSSVVSASGGVGTTTGARDDVFLFSATVAGIATAPGRKLVWDFGDGTKVTAPALPTIGEDTDLSTRHQYTVAGPHVVTLLDAANVLGSIEVTVTGAESRLEHSRRSLARTRAGWNVIAGLIAVGSGMTLLYFIDASWGTPGDYVAALLWGGGVAEGVKFVAALADGKWGDA